MFGSILGQERAKEMFARALREQTLSHAYLLSGPEGLAKTAFARELAVTLVSACGGCGVCPECERARRGIHPDLHVLEREGDLIRVAQVEPVIADLRLKPFAAGRRVWVIPEVEYLHQAAANKLLRSIEEPPDLVCFLLVTDRLERVLPTIVSRCQLVEFRPLSDEVVAGYLRESHGFDGVAAEALARLATGSVERAARLAADARGADRRAGYLKQAVALLAGGSGERAADARRAFINVLEQQQAEIATRVQADLDERLAALTRQFQDKRDLTWYAKQAEERAKREQARLRRIAAQDAVDLLGAWVRDLWVVACGASDVLWNCDRAGDLAVAAVATPEYYARLLAVVARTRKDLYLSIDHRLALQALFARFEEVAESA
ncbi:MAG: DNA polymerase III subunit [Actinobacteria bacterium]|nr:DNA polymerase III subunit [Actinomycetota bacterium]